MSSFAPAAVLTLRHFEVSENGRGYWVAKDKEGLIGGVFRTQKDALRFALFEAAGDAALRQSDFFSQTPIQIEEAGGRLLGAADPIPIPFLALTTSNLRFLEPASS